MRKQGKLNPCSFFFCGVCLKAVGKLCYTYCNKSPFFFNAAMCYFSCSFDGALMEQGVSLKDFN